MKIRSFANRVRRNRVQTRIRKFFASYASMSGRSRTLEVESLEARFTLSGPEPPIIALSLQVVSNSGTPVRTVSPGQNFKVQVIVQDLRDAELAKGVFSAFTDILFDATIIEPITSSPIAHGSNYSLAPNGDTRTVGVVDELGGLATDLFASMDGQLYLLAEVTFLAKTAGNPLLRLDAPDSVISDICLFKDSSNNEVPKTKVSFGTSNFVVGESFQQADIPTIAINNDFKRDTEQSDQALSGTQFEFWSNITSPIEIKPSKEMGQHSWLPSPDPRLASYSREAAFSFDNHSDRLSGLAFLHEDAAEDHNPSAELQSVDRVAAIYAATFRDLLYSKNEFGWLNSNQSHFIVNTYTVVIEDSSLVGPVVLVSASALAGVPATQNDHFKSLEFKTSAGKKLTGSPMPRSIDKYFSELDLDHFPNSSVRNYCERSVN